MYFVPTVILLGTLGFVSKIKMKLSGKFSFLSLLFFNQKEITLFLLKIIGAYPRNDDLLKHQHPEAALNRLTILDGS